MECIRKLKLWKFTLILAPVLVFVSASHAQANETTRQELTLAEAYERVKVLAAPSQEMDVLYSASIGEDGRFEKINAEPLVGIHSQSSKNSNVARSSVRIREDGTMEYRGDSTLPPNIDPIVFLEPSALNPPLAKPISARERVSPKLLEDVDRIQVSGIDRRFGKDVAVLITFVDDFVMPRFPELLKNEPRDSTSNRKQLERTGQLIDAVKAIRDSTYNSKTAQLEREFGARETSRFWLIPAVTVVMPLEKVLALAERADIQYIQYEQTMDAPPYNNIVDGRAVIVSDPYFPYTGGFIGLLDTGVWTGHTLLPFPNVFFTRDCVNGTAGNCTQGNGLNPNDHCNHGTATASIISGGSNLGNTSRGVTNIWLDSFNVYSAACGYNSAAGVRAFQAALSVGDSVIVGEIQSTEGYLGATSAAANAAYDAGSVVISAAGNYGPNAGSIASPGNAHRALAIGAADVSSLGLMSYSGRGPTTDGRVKPDLIAPTNTRAASTASSTALAAFGGTSGATPYGAGAAALLRNWMLGASSTVDPGQVNAHMLLSGKYLGPGYMDLGAGMIALPTGGQSYWGATTIRQGQQVDIPISAPNGIARMYAAIWWPDPTSSTHNGISIQVSSPSGAWNYTYYAGGVWQKVALIIPNQSGTWKLTIRGVNVTGTQTVYYAINTQTT